MWVDRAGVGVGAVEDTADYGHLALSPDGSRIAVSIREPGAYDGDIWIINASGERTRLTSDPADDIAPVWSPDGQRVAFASARDGSYDIYASASDGSGEALALVTAAGDQVAYDWTSSGYVLYQSDRPGTASGAHMDLWARRIPGGRAFAFLRTVHRARLPSFSPDERRVAFVLLENGAETEDVYTARFPSYNGRRRVSPRGGSWPRWRDEVIFYVDTENRLVSVEVTPDGRTVAGATPRTVSELPVKPGRGAPYDVSADGQRIVLNTSGERAPVLSRREPGMR